MESNANYDEAMSYVETEEIVDHSDKDLRDSVDQTSLVPPPSNHFIRNNRTGCQNIAENPISNLQQAGLDSGKIVYIIRPDQQRGQKRSSEGSEVIKQLVRDRLIDNERHPKHSVEDDEEDGDEDDEDDDGMIQGCSPNASTTSNFYTNCDAATAAMLAATAGTGDCLQLLQQQQFQDTSSGCLICGDRGSGFHYSAFSCEGCKGFFKRTVQKGMTYTCRESQNCDVNKLTRNNCQYCRFQKCLEVGMKKEAVREDRTPGGKHKSKMPKREAEGPDFQSLEDCINQLIQARPDLMPLINDASMDGQIDEASILEVNNLMHFGYMELRLIIEWAKKVPGFRNLVLQDQIALLKSSFMELNVLRLAFRSLGCKGSVKFTEGLEIPLDKCSSMGLGQDLIKFTLEFISRLRFTDIDAAEFAILNAIVLTYPDASGLKDKKSVTLLQTRLLDCLQHYAATRHSKEPRRYGRLLLRLPSLRTISAHAAEMFLSLSLEGNVKMNALVLEMMGKV